MKIYNLFQNVIMTCGMLEAGYLLLQLYRVATDKKRKKPNCNHVLCTVLIRRRKENNKIETILTDIIHD